MLRTPLVEGKVFSFFLSAALLMTISIAAQIPMERVLKRVTVPGDGRTRGLVGDAVERAEQEEIAALGFRLWALGVSGSWVNSAAFPKAWSPEPRALIR